MCIRDSRGIVSASVASLFSILLTQRGINGGDAIKALVFLTIILTVFLQALTAQGMANLLQVNLKSATGAVIVGCNPLSLLIARLFADQGEPVALIDTAPEARQQAEKENIRIFINSALDTEVLEEAGLATMGTFLAMTKNGEVNLVVAQQAAEEFGPPRVLAVFPRESQLNATNPKITIRQAFVPQISVKEWSQHINDGAVKLGETTLMEEDLTQRQLHLKAMMAEGRLVPLVLEREECLQVALADENWQAGDRLIYLLHDPKPKLLKLLSGSSQTRLNPEKIPEVEAIPLPPVKSEAVLEEVRTDEGAVKH
jgi:Trk K+ transport system NAD-binding subunit